MILILKLLMTPILIGLVTLVGRRWGPVVSGLLIGLPLTSGPISLILTLQYGPDFAGRAAVGSIAGQASVCIFCLTYRLVSGRLSWLASGIVAAAAYLVTAAIWNGLSLSALPGFVILLGLIAVISRFMPQNGDSSIPVRPPRLDLPARMAAATAFVVLLTTFASILGPQLSGLLSPFPVFGLVLSAFAHHQQGPNAAVRLLRGQVFGSLAFGGFFLTVALLVTMLAPVWTFTFASLIAIGGSAISFYLARENPPVVPAEVGI